MTIYYLILCVGTVLFLTGLMLPFLAKLSSPEDNMSTALMADTRPVSTLEVIIPAYLESSVIPGTIEALKNQMELWPGPATITVVASDDSTAHASVRADKVLSVGRQGKPAACNIGVLNSSADIILFTDANCRIVPNDWPIRLRSHLNLWGVVSANKVESGGADSAFWLYESKVKRLSSSRSGSLAVVGEFLAFRRTEFRPIPEATQLDDLWLAFDFHKRGHQVGIANDITTVEDASLPGDQWERRVRMTAGVLYEAIPNVSWLARSSTGRFYIAHKLYRTTVGALGFWLGVFGFAMLFPIVTVPVSVLGILWSLAFYTGRTRLGAPLRPLFALTAMQAVTVAAAGRAIRRRVRLKSQGKSDVGWKKVAR